jgi:hypothetical protein
VSTDAVKRSSNLTTALYLRLLAVVYFSAFAGLLPQLGGLYGDHGILPVATLLQFSSSFLVLQIITTCGALLAVLLFFGVLEPLMLVLLYLFYLSVVLCGQDFLSFQWDMLLLEAGFISIFLGRSKYFEFGERARHFARLALVWLTFRLMFSSGYVKLVSEPAVDSSWLSLTALTYHFETQPVPNPLAFFLSAQPEVLSRLCCFITEAVELLVPFMIFLGHRARALAALIFIALQIAIVFSGNYGFFNLLTIALSIMLMTDEDIIFGSCTRMACFLRLNKVVNWLTRIEQTNRQTRLNKATKFCNLAFWPAFALIVFASAISFGLTVLGREFFYLLPAPARFVYSFSQNWGVSSTYGLFAVMTRERPELIIEGSDNGVTFTPYQFYFKPGPLDRAPPVMATYMPRLDWQLWFEALNSESGRPSTWFVHFLEELKQGSPEVLGLLEKKPVERPRYLRVLIYKYKFTSPSELFSTGKWWKRTLVGEYCRL